MIQVQLPSSYKPGLSASLPVVRQQPTAMVKQASPEFGANSLRTAGMKINYGLSRLFDTIDANYLWSFLALDVVAMWLPRFVVGLARGRYEYEPTTDPSNVGLSPWQQLGKTIHKNVAGLNYTNFAEDFVREFFTAPGVLVIPTFLFLWAYNRDRGKGTWMGRKPLNELSYTFNKHLHDLDQTFSSQSKKFDISNPESRAAYQDKVKAFFKDLFQDGKAVRFDQTNRFAISISRLEKNLKDKGIKVWLQKQYLKQHQDYSDTDFIGKSRTEVEKVFKQATEGKTIITFNNPQQFTQALIDDVADQYAKRTLSLMNSDNLQSNTRVKKAALKDVNHHLSTTFNDFEFLMRDFINNERINADPSLIGKTHLFDIKQYKPQLEGKQVTYREAFISKQSINNLLDNLHKFKDNILKILTEQRKHNFTDPLADLGRIVHRRTIGRKFKFTLVATALGSLYLYYIPRWAQKHGSYPANRLLDQKMKELQGKTAALPNAKMMNSVQPPLTVSSFAGPSIPYTAKAKFPAIEMPFNDVKGARA